MSNKFFVQEKDGIDRGCYGTIPITQKIQPIAPIPTVKIKNKIQMIAYFKFLLIKDSNWYSHTKFQIITPHKLQINKQINNTNF